MKSLTTEIFMEVIALEEKVLVDFWATWCEPCKAMVPILQDIHETILPVYKVDVDAEIELAKQMGIRSMPTLILFENGEEIARMIGARPKNEIVEVLGL